MRAGREAEDLGRTGKSAGEESRWRNETDVINELISEEKKKWNIEMSNLQLLGIAFSD